MTTGVVVTGYQISGSLVAGSHYDLVMITMKIIGFLISYH